MRKDLACQARVELKNSKILYEKRVPEKYRSYIIARSTRLPAIFFVKFEFVLQRTEDGWGKWLPMAGFKIANRAASHWRYGLKRLFEMPRSKFADLDGAYLHEIKFGQKQNRICFSLELLSKTWYYKIQKLYFSESHGWQFGREIFLSKVSDPRLFRELDKALADIEEMLDNKLIPAEGSISVDIGDI